MSGGSASIFWADALSARLTMRQTAREATNRLVGRLTQSANGDPDAWRRVYAELLSFYDAWIGGGDSSRGDLGPAELALIPLATQYVQSMPRTRLRVPPPPEEVLRRIRAVYTDPDAVRRLETDEGEAAVGALVFPFIDADARALEQRQDTADAYDPQRLRAYATCVHLLVWTNAVGRLLRMATRSLPPSRASTPSLSPGPLPPPSPSPLAGVPLPRDLLLIQANPQGQHRSAAQGIFVAMCVPTCEVPVEQRLTGSITIDAWQTNPRHMEPAYIEQINYCRAKFNGVRWAEDAEDEDDAGEDEEDEDGIEAGLTIRAPGEFEVDMRAADPLIALIKNREAAKRRALVPKSAVRPTPAMRDACEDAWRIMAWGFHVDAQTRGQIVGTAPLPGAARLGRSAGEEEEAGGAHRDFGVAFPTVAVPVAAVIAGATGTTGGVSADLHTFRECLVQAHDIGSAQAQEKLRGSLYRGVRRLPALVLVTLGVYIVRCHVCTRLSRHPRIDAALEAWFACVKACYGGMDGFNRRVV